MREILFRGKQTTTGNWLYGDFRYHNGMNPHKGWIEHRVPHPVEGNDPTCHLRSVNLETLGQYVGLKDADGRKIFEGDILESPVKRVGAKFGPLIVITDIRECKYVALYVSEYRVIGNVYDNPEFLELKESMSFK